MKLSILLIVLGILVSSCFKVPQVDIMNTATPVKITYLTHVRGTMSEVNMSQNDLPLSKYLDQVTGITVEYIAPENDDYLKAINMHMASGNPPDIIDYDWADYPGGQEKAINDGMLLPLNDILPKYAPDFYERIQKEPDISSYITTPSGKIFGFPMIPDDEILKTYAGMVVRKDWLDMCGLDIPETIDEWEIVLTAFKQQLGAEIPLSAAVVRHGDIGVMGAYGIINDFYIEDGVVKHGAMEDAYYDFVLRMREWYVKGLLDSDFGRRSNAHVISDFLEDRLGASILALGAEMGTTQELADAAGKDNFLLEAAPYPVLEKGKRPKFGHIRTRTATTSISALSKNIEAACRFLNYGYTQEGSLTYNFGILGESYTMENGRPVYTDIVTNNPTLTTAQAIAQYARANDSGPFIQMKDYIFQYYSTPQLKEALELWLQTDAKHHVMPAMSFDVDDTLTIQDQLQTLHSYTYDKFARFVMGVDSLDSIPEYQQEIKELSKNLLEIYQRSYNNYDGRK